MSAERFHSCISRGILGAKQLACFGGCSGEETIHVLPAHWSGDATVTRHRAYSWEFSGRVHITALKKRRVSVKWNNNNRSSDVMHKTTLFAVGSSHLLVDICKLLIWFLTNDGTIVQLLLIFPSALLFLLFYIFFFTSSSSCYFQRRSPSNLPTLKVLEQI
jgi:hypothetical protein